MIHLPFVVLCQPLPQRPVSLSLSLTLTYKTGVMMISQHYLLEWGEAAF